ncbi:MAG: hypothetical protein DRJ18_00155 [Candidatus Methanomethylicota archaeon]|nr:MAG: hypothetical protein DRJ18_00155 [Candidatus Verstraetearchaeota archaeon]
MGKRSKIPNNLRNLVGKKIVVSVKRYYQGPVNWVKELRTLHYDPKKQSLYYKYKGKKHYVKPSDIKV